MPRLVVTSVFLLFCVLSGTPGLIQNVQAQDIIIGQDTPLPPPSAVPTPAPFSDEQVQAPSSLAEGAMPPSMLDGTDLTLLEMVRAGGWAMYPLAALSIIGTMLVFVYLFTIRRGAVVTGNFMATTDALLRKRDFLGLLAVANRRHEAVARVVARSLDFLTKNPGAAFAQVREIAETEGTRQASLLNQRITYLADVGAIAPMVGLLGTVTGMIKSFSVLANDVAATRPMLLADGVSEALVTTAVGLIIGIPAMSFYAYFRGKVQNLIADLEASSTQVLAQLAQSCANPPRSSLKKGPASRSATEEMDELQLEEEF